MPISGGIKNKFETQNPFNKFYDIVVLQNFVLKIIVKIVYILTL